MVNIVPSVPQGRTEHFSIFVIKALVYAIGNTFSQLVGQWAAAATSGTLLTAKHDINGPTRNEPIRSVLSQEMSASLETFVRSGSYSIDEYFNNEHKNYYYVLIPDTAYAFDPGYTVLSGSQATGSAFDSLVIFSGSRQGGYYCRKFCFYQHRRRS